MMRIRRRLDGWLTALALCAAALALGFLSQRHAWVSDWTRGQRASLAPESRAVLAHLAGPVTVTCYASPGELRQTVTAFLERYRRLKPDLTLRFVDPQQDPAAMRALGVSVDGTLILTYHGRSQRLDELSERSFSNALERLARGGERLVAFVTGDGERRADGRANADLGTFVAQLEPRGLRALPLNFTEATAVPAHTDLVVLASPQTTLPDGAVRALVDYLQRGGNLLWLTEPGGDAGLAPLAAALGIRVLPGVLVDGGGAALGLKDPRLIALGSYPAHPITRGFLLTTLFPEVAALARTDASAWAAVPFLRSGTRSWTELQPIREDAESTIRYDPAAGELQGPLDFGFALSRLSPSPDKDVQRAVVIGDGDFLSNAYLGNGGNRALGERIVDWLLGDDVLVNLPPRGAPDRALDLSQRALGLLGWGFLVGLPLLLLAVGGLIYGRRRRR
ncbi:MAG: Gldg family protein [Fulvimonas sp.]|nr:Gldg family protein [Fulvimonas sp.]